MAAPYSMHRTAATLLALLAFLHCVHGAAKPSVYWASVPTLANETLVVAGAGLEGAAATFCLDAACARPVPAPAPAKAWAQSVKAVLPRDCGPPCWLRVATAGGDTVLAVNGPDLWWAIADTPSQPSTAAAPPAETTALATILVGQVLRVFGRGLAWHKDPATGGLACAGARTPLPAPDTKLVLGGSHAPLAATSATCYEATFPTGSLPPGEFPGAVLQTPWGEAPLPLTVQPQPTPAPIVDIDVLGDYDGSLPRALAAAQTAAAAGKAPTVHLGAHAYTLDAALSIPAHTRLLGKGAAQSEIRLVSKAGPAPPPGTCGAPQNGTDFYAAACDRSKGACFSDLGVLHDVPTLAACCDRCRADPHCNGYTVAPGENLCILKSCPDHSCPRTAGEATRVSAWLEGRNGTTGDAAAFLTVADGVSLVDFSIVLDPSLSTPKLAAVWQPSNVSGLLAEGLNISMRQNNVSNAFRIEGSDFELVGNFWDQVGPCLWPPHSDTSPFQASVSLYLHGSRNGKIAGNDILWQCSAFDLDTSERVIFEDNRIHLTYNGVVPHGNSISGYDWRAHPASQWWSVSRNALERPPCTPGTEQNWRQRETMTTDGSGQFGTARVTASKGSSVSLSWLVFDVEPEVGATLVVLNGSAVGQSRTITAVVDNVTLIVASPFDAFLDETSLVAVVSSFGHKVVAGNTFVWTEVVQWYGNTLVGVHADNTFTNCNVLPAGGDGAGALQGVGECYHGSGSVFFTEYLGNELVSSDGILLKDNGDNHEPECSAFTGPWIRWAVVRRNAFSGVSAAAKYYANQTHATPKCGGVRLISNPVSDSTDIVAEHNAFSCPPGNTPAGYSLDNCSHCQVRV